MPCGVYHSIVHRRLCTVRWRCVCACFLGMDMLAQYSGRTSLPLYFHSGDLYPHRHRHERAGIPGLRAWEHQSSDTQRSAQWLGPARRLDVCTSVRRPRPLRMVCCFLKQGKANCYPLPCTSSLASNWMPFSPCTVDVGYLFVVNRDVTNVFFMREEPQGSDRTACVTCHPLSLLSFALVHSRVR